MPFLGECVEAELPNGHTVIGKIVATTYGNPPMASIQCESTKEIFRIPTISVAKVKNSL